MHAAEAQGPDSTGITGGEGPEQDRLDLEHSLALAFSGEWRHGRTGIRLGAPVRGVVVQVFLAASAPSRVGGEGRSRRHDAEHG